MNKSRLLPAADSLPLKYQLLFIPRMN